MGDKTAIPVLMYHHVSPRPGDMVTVTPEVFDAQMRYIKDSGIRTLSIKELLDVIVSGSKVSGKCAVVTFDDGYLDNYIYAFPALKKYGIKAAVFLVSSWAEGASKGRGAADADEFRKDPPGHDKMKSLIKEGRYGAVSVSWEMAREMMEGGLVEFHSHTRSHNNCDTLGDAELKDELEGSKRVIEAALSTPCEYLCWPRGRFDQRALEAARKAGYRAVFTTRHGVEGQGGDPFSIKRIVVKDSLRWFKTRLFIYTNPLTAGLYLSLKGKS